MMHAIHVIQIIMSNSCFGVVRTSNHAWDWNCSTKGSKNGGIVLAIVLHTPFLALKKFLRFLLSFGCTQRENQCCGILYSGRHPGHAESNETELRADDQDGGRGQWSTETSTSEEKQHMKMGQRMDGWTVRMGGWVGGMKWNWMWGNNAHPLLHIPIPRHAYALTPYTNRASLELTQHALYMYMQPPPPNLWSVRNQGSRAPVRQREQKRGSEERNVTQFWIFKKKQKLRNFGEKIETYWNYRHTPWGKKSQLALRLAWTPWQLPLEEFT